MSHSQIFTLDTRRGPEVAPPQPQSMLLDSREVHMTDADALTRALKYALPESITTLPENDRDDLARLIEQAAQTRVEQLTTDAFGALDNVPGFLRGAVRRAVGL